jgi:hypothetical protein
MKSSSFLKSVKDRQPWFWSFVYHLSSLIIYRLLPSQSLNNANQVIFQTNLENDSKMIVNISNINIGKSGGVSLATFANIIIYDLIFVITFILIKKYSGKRHNIFAILFVVVIMNLFFLLYLKSVIVNLF